MVQVKDINGMKKAALSNIFLSGFIDVCPSGSIDRQSIAEIYAMPRRNAEKFIEQMFRMFDRDGDGKISFRGSTFLLSIYIIAEEKNQLIEH